MANALTLVKALMVRLAPCPAPAARHANQRTAFLRCGRDRVAAVPPDHAAAMARPGSGSIHHDERYDGNVRGRNPAWNQVIIE